MNKKTKPINIDGLLPIYKPKDMVSKDVSRKLQKTYGKLKLGHVGTLDPMAEGVLPIVLGKATRLQDYLLGSEKIYEVEIKIGTQTDTLDITGEVVSEVDFSDFPDASADVDQILEGFVGKLTQIPPIYSAVKYKGKPLYEYARSGEADLVPLDELGREIEVYFLENLGTKSNEGKLTNIRVRISCSKGTYIRVLVHDICQKLGTEGTMETLVRTKTAGVEASQCINILDLVDTPELLGEKIIHMANMPISMTRLYVDEQNESHLFHGRRVNFIIDQISNYVVKIKDERSDPKDLDEIETVLIQNKTGEAIGIGELVRHNNNDARGERYILTKKRGL